MNISLWSGVELLRVRHLPRVQNCLSSSSSLGTHGEDNGDHWHKVFISRWALLRPPPFGVELELLRLHLPSAPPVLRWALVFFPFSKFWGTWRRWWRRMRKIFVSAGMVQMFTYAQSFNLDLSQWNVSSVTNMYGMLTYAQSFNQDLPARNIMEGRTMASLLPRYTCP